MTLLFCDGFDHYAEGDTLKKWTYYYDATTILGSEYARFNGQGILLNNSNSNNAHFKDLGDNYTTLIFGGALKLIQTPTGVYPTGDEYLFRFSDTGTTQVGICMDAELKIRAYNGDEELLGTSSNAVPLNNWFYIEFKVTFNATSGSVEVRVNGTTYLTLTSKDTISTANAYANRIYVGANYHDADVYWDDIYVCDTSGSYNNDFLGDITIETLHPSGAGNSSQLTPSAGSNYENVDDATDIDDDTTYNEGSTVGYKDTYAMDDMTGTGTIKAVAFNLCARKTDAGSKGIQQIARVNSTDYDIGSAEGLFDNYKIYQGIAEVNPDDSAAWEAADVNGMEAGVEIDS